MFNKGSEVHQGRYTVHQCDVMQSTSNRCTKIFSFNYSLIRVEQVK